MCILATSAAGGVKQYSRADFERIKPILAGRMAGYLIALGRNYAHVTTFAEGRYGDVMAAARMASQATFSVLPAQDGPRMVRMGSSTPHKYWEKYWIQLYLEIGKWLTPAARKHAAERLTSLDVEFKSETRGSASRR